MFLLYTALNFQDQLIRHIGLMLYGDSKLRGAFRGELLSFLDFVVLRLFVCYEDTRCYLFKVNTKEYCTYDVISLE